MQAPQAGFAKFGRWTGAALAAAIALGIFGVYAARRKASRPSLIYCGDDKDGKQIAAGLIRDVGFDPVDAGPLRIARYTEPFALLVAQLAYEGSGGPELAYRLERLAR